MAIKRVAAIAAVATGLTTAAAGGVGAEDGLRIGPMGGVVSHAMVMFGAPRYDDGFDHLSYVEPDAPKGGDLRLHVVGGFDSLNHYIDTGSKPAGRQYVRETLMGRVWDEPFTLYGLLAESVEMPEDRSWVAFTLRPEARWHDGSPVTVDDVVFSIETLTTIGRARYQLYAAAIASVNIVGERTVRIDFTAEANRETPMIIGLLPMLSKSWYETRPFAEPTLEPPMSSGPYRVAEVDPGVRVVYERVPDYWGAELGLARGLYNFDRVIYEYYRDGAVALEAFFTGGYDFRGEPDPARWATGYDALATRAGDIVMEEIGNDRPSGMRALVFNTRRPLFQDIRVRRALSYAVDFPTMNATLFHGAYARTVSLFGNSPLGFTGVPQGAELALLAPYRDRLPADLFTEPFQVPGAEDGATLRQNLSRATQLLREAGWTVRDGVLVDRSGAPFEFEILLVNASLERVALSFADNLERLGITAAVRTVDSAQYQQRRNEFDFDMVIHRWGVTLSPGNEQNLYWGGPAAVEPGSRNYAGVQDPVIDALIVKLTDARSSEDLAAAAMAMDRVLMWGAYFIPLYYSKVDRVAYWNALRHPPEPSLYGNVLEAWWSADAETP